MTERSSVDVFSDAPRLAIRNRFRCACGGKRRHRLGTLSIALLTAVLIGTSRMNTRPDSVSAADVRRVPATAVSTIPPAAAKPAAAPIQADDLVKALGNLAVDSPASSLPASDLKGDPFQTATKTAPDDSADEPLHRRESERRQILAAVQQLQLAAILKGVSRRACLIDNSILQEGQEINGFTVEEIAATVVVVRKGAYRFELRIDR